MTYEMSMREQDGHLRVEFTGERTVQNLAKVGGWLEEMARVCEERGLKRILIVSTAKGVFPTSLAYQMGSGLAEFGFRPEWKTAYVNDDSQIRENVQFSENVATNRGMSGKFFTSEEEALEWLST